MIWKEGGRRKESMIANRLKQSEKHGRREKEEARGKKDF